MKDEEKSWEELSPELRAALIKNAKSHLWWKELGIKIKALGPLITVILGLLALWQILGEYVQKWLSSGA